MKKLIIIIILFLVFQFIFFANGLNSIEGTIDNNVKTANERANAQAKIILDQRAQINDLREAIKLMAQHVKNN